MVSHFLADPAMAAFVTAVLMSALAQIVGRLGRFVEAQGAARKILALVVIGKQLEAIGYDADKLHGKPGTPEAPLRAAEAAGES